MELIWNGVTLEPSKRPVTTVSDSSMLAAIKYCIFSHLNILGLYTHFQNNGNDEKLKN